MQRLIAATFAFAAAAAAKSPTAAFARENGRPGAVLARPGETLRTSYDAIVLDGTELTAAAVRAALVWLAPNGTLYVDGRSDGVALELRAYAGLDVATVFDDGDGDDWAATVCRVRPNSGEPLAPAPPDADPEDHLREQLRFMRAGAPETAGWFVDAEHMLEEVEIDDGLVFADSAASPLAHPAHRINATVQIRVREAGGPRSVRILPRTERALVELATPARGSALEICADVRGKGVSCAPVPPSLEHALEGDVAAVWLRDGEMNATYGAVALA